MKVVLVYPTWTSNYGIATYFAKRASVWPPLNLANLAAVAEKKGHEVRIVDGQVENMSLRKTIEQIEVFKPDIIGITATTPFYHIASDLARGLKHSNSKTPIAVGGPHISILREKAFSSFWDYAFIGEADESWPMFLEQYENGKDVSNVKGILYRDGGNVKFTGMPDPIDDLDSIPFPARHLLKMNKYKLGTSQGTKNFTSIMYSRGCPFKCIFCNTKLIGHRVRRRSVRLVVDEIISVVSHFNIRHFYFADDNLTLNRDYTLQMCDMIDKEGLSITFEGSTRANLIDEELISRMAKSGLIRISFGLETVDPEMRRIMRKEVPLESYATANRLTNEYGVETLNSVMIGMPGETRETVKKTLSYLRNARDIQQANCSIAVPYPGTELYEMAERGEHGLRLMTKDFREYRRYSSAVMSVGSLSPDDLIKLQNAAFVSIYAAPWRWKPMLKKMGLIGGLLTFSRLIISIAHLLVNKASKTSQ